MSRQAIEFWSKPKRASFHPCPTATTNRPGLRSPGLRQKCGTAPKWWLRLKNRSSRKCNSSAMVWCSLLIFTSLPFRISPIIYLRRRWWALPTRRSRIGTAPCPCSRQCPRLLDACRSKLAPAILSMKRGDEAFCSGAFPEWHRRRSQSLAAASLVLMQPRSLSEWAPIPQSSTSI